MIRAFSTLEGVLSISNELLCDRSLNRFPVRLCVSFTGHLAGIGYLLDPDFSFAKIAAPYAQVPLLVVQGASFSGDPSFETHCGTSLSGASGFETATALGDAAHGRDKETSQ